VNRGEGALERPGLVVIDSGPEKSFGIARSTVDGHEVMSSMSTGPWLTGPAGHPVGGGDLHGGITFAACDLVAQAALLAAGGPTLTASISVAYPRPIPLGTTPRFQARLLHCGRALGIVAITVTTDDAKPRAIATVTTGLPG